MKRVTPRPSGVSLRCYSSCSFQVVLFPALGSLTHTLCQHSGEDLQVPSAEFWALPAPPLLSAPCSALTQLRPPGPGPAPGARRSLQVAAGGASFSHDSASCVPVIQCLKITVSCVFPVFTYSSWESKSGPCNSILATCGSPSLECEMTESHFVASVYQNLMNFRNV